MTQSLSLVEETSRQGAQADNAIYLHPRSNPRRSTPTDQKKRKT